MDTFAIKIAANTVKNHTAVIMEVALKVVVFVQNILKEHITVNSVDWTSKMDSDFSFYSMGKLMHNPDAKNPLIEHTSKRITGVIHVQEWSY